MRLRNLEQKDADFMFEWMQDDIVVRNLQTNFKEKKLEDCKKFISYSQNSKNDIHMAIVDDYDNYMGTVSLKHIVNNSAEFAITCRKCAFGKGFAKYGMYELIKLAFEELKINNIYWCVNTENKRAVRFYDKNRFNRVNIYESGLFDIVHLIGKYTEFQINNYIWYAINK